MRWEERLLDLFDDLEQQAEGLALAGRDAEVAEQARAEDARVDLDPRVHASTGAELRLWVAGLGPLDARLVQVGDGWCLLVDERTEWLGGDGPVRRARGRAHRVAGADRRGRLRPRAVRPRARPGGAPGDRPARALLSAAGRQRDPVPGGRAPLRRTAAARSRGTGRRGLRRGPGGRRRTAGTGGRGSPVHRTRRGPTLGPVRPGGGGGARS